MNYLRSLFTRTMGLFVMVHFLEDVTLITIGAYMHPWWVRYAVGLIVSSLIFGVILRHHKGDNNAR